MSDNKKPISDMPSSTSLRRARDEFAFLLQQRTPEADWQTFFAQNPFVLSRGLPLQLLPCDILPFGRPGRSEPDFLLHPGSPRSKRIHGVVELKTNHAKITTRGRKPELVLSRDAAVAARQLNTYDKLYDSFAPTQRVLALDTLSHLFVIMGNSDELLKIEERLRPQIREILPPGIRFLTFDELFRGYSTDLPKPVSLLRRPLPPVSDLAAMFALAKESKVTTRLHRIVMEAYSSFDFGGPQEREIRFDRWIDDLFSRPPHVSTRFQPPEAPALHATNDYDTALAELHAQRLAMDGNALSQIRYRHFKFEYSGWLVSLRPDAVTRELLRSADFRASQLFAKEALDRGFDAIAYPSELGRGEHYAILNRKGVGKVLDSRVVDGLND